MYRIYKIIEFLVAKNSAGRISLVPWTEETMGYSRLKVAKTRDP